MTRQKVTTILGVVLVFACVANAGLAQTQATTTNGTQTSGRISLPPRWPSRRANPFASSWADAATAEQQLDGDAPRRRSTSGAEQSDVPAVDESEADREAGADYPSHGAQWSIPSPISIRAGRMSGPPGSATPFSHLRCRVRCSAAGSWSAQARRSFFRRHRRMCSARTPGRWGLMREPRCSASTSSPMASCSNGSRSAATAGTPTR